MDTHSAGKETAADTKKDFLTLLEKYIPREREEFSLLEKALGELETGWIRREQEICDLKDRELLSLGEQLTDAHRKEQFINEIGRRLTSSLKLESIISTFHSLIRSRIPADRILLAFYNRLDESLVYRVFEEDSHENDIPGEVYLSTTHRLVVKAVQEGRLMVYNNLPSDDEEFFARKGGSMILSPLRIEGCVRGIILLQTDDPEAYSDEQSSFLESLAPFLAVATANARSHEEVETLNGVLKQDKHELMSAHARITRMANYDSLTDLPNLRLLNEFLPRYMEQAKRQEWTLAVLFIDLDDFKPVNDTYGHETGDRILVEASERIKNSLRKSDVVARVGGDEFIALVQAASGREGAASTAEKILAGFTGPFSAGGNDCRLGASIGISLFPGDGHTPGELKNMADRAMYKVKEKGKSGYSFFQD